ncbi:MAG: MASE3 domain-containing protein [Candidatus Omnitrophota bacterium]
MRVPDKIILLPAWHFIVATLVALVLYIVSLQHFLLFHNLAEIFSIVIACGIFMFAVNSRKFLDNGYFVFLGTAYLLVAGLDMLHMLAYKGMGVIFGYSSDLATQIWIAARYLQALALLVAPFSIRDRKRLPYLLAAFGLAAGLFVLSIFYWRTFPRCFVDGLGVTAFKTVSEYCIIAMLGLAIFVTAWFRRAFSAEVMSLLAGSIVITVFSEFAFSSYTDLYGIANAAGHILKIAAFYLIYKAVVETGIKNPYEILLRDLKQNEERLRASEERFKDISYSIADWVWEVNPDGIFTFCSSKVEEVLGYTEKEMLGKMLFDFMEPGEAVRNKARFENLKTNKWPIKDLENWNITKDGRKICLLTNAVPILDAGGNLLGYRGVDKDVTLRKKVEQHVRWLASFPRKNPNPIVELDLAGHIYYTNPVARVTFPDMQSLGINHPLFGNWRNAVEFFARPGETVYRRELQIGGKWFHQTFAYEQSRIRIYSVDITERKQVEELLLKKQEEMEIIFDSVPALIFYKDKCNRLLRVNKAFAEITGKTKEELENQALFDMYPREQAEAFFKDDKEVFSSGKPKFNIIESINTKDGVCWLETNKVPYRDAHGDIIGVIGFAIDITERKYAEAVIRDSLQRFELLTGTAEELLKSPHPQRLVESLCRKVMEFLDCQVFFNFLADETSNRLHLNAFAGIPAAEARKIERLDYGVAVCGCVAKSGVRIVAEHIPSTPDARTELVKSYGIKAYACHPLIGSDGSVAGTLSFGTTNRETFSAEDLSLMNAVAYQVSIAMSRLRKERLIQSIQLEISNARLLKDERLRLYSVLETLPVYVILLRPDHHVTFANKFFRDRFGEDKGRPCFEYLFNHREPCENCQSFKVLENNSPHQWAWTGPDGRDYDVYDFPFKESDGSIHILEMGIDISERKRAQEALANEQRAHEQAKRLADVGALSATVAHELRNPLAAIKMAAYNVMRKAKNPELDKHLHNIDKKIHESNQIISNLLFYSRIKPPQREKTRLCDIISEAVVSAQERFPKHKAVLENHIDAAADVFVEVDPVQIKEVFDNVLNNAYDAVNTDGGHIGITAKPSEDNIIEIHVRDNGGGISAENLGRVKEPFFTTKAKGTGLGLAVCSQIIQLHDGTLDIASKLGEGTDNIIRLPVCVGGGA